MEALYFFNVLTAVACYVAFTVFCCINLFRRVTGLALLFACLSTLIWIVTPLIPHANRFYLVLEPIAILSWVVLLVRALGLTGANRKLTSTRPLLWVFSLALFASTVAVFTAINPSMPLIWNNFNLAFNLPMLIVNVLGLVLVEQLSRNVIADFAWRLRYLNLGLGMIFGFGLTHHAVALLLAEPVLALIVIQPAVMALLVPFVVIASLRNQTNRLKFSLTRNFIFRSGVLAVTGAFLIGLGIFGYLVQLFAGDIGIALAVLIGIASITFFITIISSTQFRRTLRVLLSKTFFEYRYDYREEWQKVTARLTEPDPDFNLTQQALRTMLSVLNAKTGCLWQITNRGNFLAKSHIGARHWMKPISRELGHALTRFYTHHDWVLDLNDMPKSAEGIANSLYVINELEECQFIVPLFIESQLFGICIMGVSDTPKQLEWEDFDIVKLIAKQCAGFLALDEANQSLAEQQQLSAVNQMSAFLMHDIKTIASQLSLMLDNAERHKDNPDFIDDMLKTTDNAVQRMKRILAGLDATDAAHLELDTFELNSFLRRLVEAPNYTSVQLDLSSEPLVVFSQSDALTTALTHLLNNAQEALDADGTVSIHTQCDHEWAFIRVIDTGHGMSEEFVRTELFQPFRSTKGLTGMGVGAYQAREQLRQMGCDLQVDSKAGVGTTFTITVPLTT